MDVRGKTAFLTKLQKNANCHGEKRRKSLAKYFLVAWIPKAWTTLTDDLKGFLLL